MSTDIDWERWGAKDPYYGVITAEKYRNSNLTEEARREFFESGIGHVNGVLSICRRHMDRDFSPRTVLDFGCGVGRLVIPFARIAEQVVGLDVSESMLAEARKNCEEYGVRNVTLALSDDNLTSLEGRFDLIHSTIVFQHIPAERGQQIFAGLLTHLDEGGIGALQFLYANAYFGGGSHPSLTRPAHRLRRTAWLFKRRLARPSTAEDPEMQMNPYQVNELFFLMQKAGIRNTFIEFTDHGGELAVFLFFQKPRAQKFASDNAAAGAGTGSGTASVTLAAATQVTVIAHPQGPSDYFDTVQKAYVGYYQRPADPAGLIWWAERLYESGGNLAHIIKAFAQSAESHGLYGTINSSTIPTVVNGIYKALFNREAEPEGLNFYVDGFDKGDFTAATIMLNILFGARNEDLQSIDNKLAAANLFTRTIDPELHGTNPRVTYEGEEDAGWGRDFLAAVTSDSATIPTQEQAAAYVKANIADPGDAILNS